MTFLFVIQITEIIYKISLPDFSSISRLMLQKLFPLHKIHHFQDPCAMHFFLRLKIFKFDLKTTSQESKDAVF